MFYSVDIIRARIGDNGDSSYNGDAGSDTLIN